ncbi:hypothetical protein CALVIDRAFT_561003 [Calocera viscosa TUFC12733]|uniref:Protein BNI4 n=1 Tax=Calocera viscosa (strain TUFC12733) TaxID=1330018 RepID=A0A167QE82_CALVF|nr:hypothetical protein CALVIDRAFT_561003 [Calocera viscosa TUFC12733]
MAVQLANPNDFPPLPSMDANPGSPAHSSQQLGQHQLPYMTVPFAHQQQQMAPQPSPSPHQQWPSIQHPMPAPPPQYFPHMHGYAPFPMPHPHAQFSSQQQQQQQLWAYQHMLYTQPLPPMPEFARVDRPRTMSNPQQAPVHQMTSPPMDPQQAFWSQSASHYNTQPFVPQHPGSQRQPFDPARGPAHSYDSSLPFQPMQPSHRPHPSEPYQGFHPYRRPARSETAPPSMSVPDWPQDAAHALPSHQPPYARPDAAGSATSIGSSSGGSSRGPAERNRVGSLPGSNGSPQQTPPHSRQSSASQAPRPENGVNHGRSASQVSITRPPQQHRRDSSSASERSATPSISGPTAQPGAVQSRPPTASVPSGRPTKPSPLSKDPTFPDANGKRISKTDDDLPTAAGGASLARTALVQATSSSDLAAAGAADPTDRLAKSGGLKGRLRRALSFSAIQTLDEEDPSLKAAANRRKAAAAAAAKEKTKEAQVAQDAFGPSAPSATTSSPPLTPAGNDDTEPSVRKLTKKPKRSLFKKGFNASTDNISLSSTASSASLMIRKLGGSVGNLARKASLANIAGFLKDKHKDGETKGKSGAATASVSMATAEVDRGPQAPEELGLSPAARLARQHTLRSNAEAAAKAQAAAAARQEPHAPDEHGSTAVPATWDRNTTKRTPPGTPRSAGRLPVLEDDRWEENDREEHVGFAGEEALDDEESDPEEDDELTIRMSGISLTDEVEPWAVGVRRSMERIRQPAKGILKSLSPSTNTALPETDNPLDAQHYDQNTFEAPSLIRSRANSYGSAAQPHQEPGPLARLPSADPDHIDGLQQREHSDQEPESAPEDAFKAVSPAPQLAVDKPAFQYNHPNFNSSAPSLSTFGLPPMAQRAATTPLAARRLAFATNLSVYSTFSSSMYDRRSEPATCNRLTPQLAQRIKEELNTYKMEEMEVHHASRIHTHFFV